MANYNTRYDIICVSDTLVATRYVFDVGDWSTALEIFHIVDGAWESVEQYTSVDIPATYLGGELTVRTLPGYGGNPTKTILAGRVVSFSTT